MTDGTARPAAAPALALRLLRDHAITFVAVLLVAGVFAGNPTFLSFFNIANMLSQWALAG